MVNRSSWNKQYGYSPQIVAKDLAAPHNDGVESASLAHRVVFFAIPSAYYSPCILLE
jgi:hypothetical protein